MDQTSGFAADHGLSDKLLAEMNLWIKFHVLKGLVNQMPIIVRRVPADFPQ